MTTTPNLPFGYYEYANTSNATREKINLISGSVEATRVFHGPWANRFNFIFQHLLQPIVFSGVTQYAVPQAYPDYPIIHADTVEVRGFGTASANAVNNQASWTNAAITCNYRSHTFNFSAEPQTSVNAYINRIFLEEEHDEYTEELLTGKNDPVYFDNVVFDERYKYQLRRGDLTITQSYIISPPWTLWDWLKNKANGKVFISPSGKVYKKDTLKYEGYSARTKVNVENLAGEDFPLPVFEVTHRFSFNAIGWNHTIHKGVKKEVLNGALNHFYPQKDLFNIFFPFDTAFADAQLNTIQAQMDLLETNIKTLPFTHPTIKNSFTIIRDTLLELGFRV